MRLKKIEVQGFKSFADRTILNFDEKFSVIVGPNGSGKSNIADAVRWVLGEQSSKALRSSKMDDVIFSGTERISPKNYARVSLFFENVKNHIEIDFDEVEISRKIYRDGGSEYSINNQQVRLKDVRELFLDTGIGKEGYSIIGQGRIDEILSSKAEDRRYIFDEAAGVSKFKHKKDESIKKLEKTEDNLQRVMDIMSEMEKRRDYLEKEKDKAIEGTSLLEELNQHQLSHLKTQGKLYDKDIKKIINEHSISLEEKMELGKDYESLESKSSDLLNLLASKKEELGRLQSQAEAAYKTLNKANLDLKIDEEKLEQNKKDIKSNQEKLKDYKKNLEELERNLAEKNIDLDGLKNKLELQRKELEKGKLAQKEKEILETDLIKKLNYYEEEISTLENTYNQGLLNESTNKRLLANLEKEILEQRDEKLQLSNEIEDLKTKANKLEGEIKELENQLFDGLEIIKDEEILLEKKKDNYMSLENFLRDKLSDKKRHESNKNILESIHDNYEGYYKPVQNLLKSSENQDYIKSLFLGTVADLLKVEDEYKKAIELVLSSQLQNIVTRTAEDAKILIEYMKKHSLGRLTFLPLNRLKSFQINTKNLSKDMYLIHGVDAVLVDEDYEILKNYLLSRTIITRELDQSLKASKVNTFNRYVTLDGDIINSGGSMVGGSKKNNYHTSLINRKDEILEIEKNIGKLNLEINELEHDILVENDSIRELDVKFNFNKDKYQNKEKLKNNLLEKLREINNKKDILKSHISNINNSIEKNKNKVKEIKESSKKVDTINEEEYEGSQRKFEEFSKSLEDLNNNLTNIKFENIRLQNKFDLTERDLKLVENKISELNEQIENTNLRINDSYESTLLLEGIQESLLEQINTNQNLHDEKTRLYNLCKNNELNLSKSLSSLEEENNKNNELKLELSKKINNIELSISKLENRRINIEEKKDNLLNSYLEENFTSKDELLSKIENFIEIETNPGKIKELKTRLKALGNFSYEAIEEFKLVDEEYKMFFNQKEDLTKAREDILKIIEELDEKISLSFEEKFEVINKNFNRIFNKLFNGGSANLILVGEDSLNAGVDFKIQPPGSRLSSLDLLSGGERALTAVALLFAIFETKPAPFCILDEVDAALDDANIGRYISYLKSFEDVQFIIITHRKKTMEVSDTLYGVTMEEEGISKVLSLQLKKLEEEYV